MFRLSRMRRTWTACGYHVEHAFDPPRPILSRSMLGGRYVAFAGQRLHLEEDLSDAVAHVFVIHSRGSSRCARYGLAHFPDELLTAFIHADHRIIDIVRTFLDGEDVLHTGYERGASPFFPPSGDRPLSQPPPSVCPGPSQSGTRCGCAGKNCQLPPTPDE